MNSLNWATSILPCSPHLLRDVTILKESLGNDRECFWGTLQGINGRDEKRRKWRWNDSKDGWILHAGMFSEAWCNFLRLGRCVVGRPSLHRVCICMFLFSYCSVHNCSTDSWIWILYYLHVLQCDVCGSLNFCWYIPKVAPVTGFTHEVIHCWGLLRKVRPFLQACTCLSTRKQRISTLIWYPISIFRFIYTQRLWERSSPQTRHGPQPEERKNWSSHCSQRTG